MGRENRYICRNTCVQIQQIHYKPFFMLSNKIELFKRMRSLGLRNAISTYGYICLAYSCYVQHVHTSMNDPLPITAIYYSARGGWKEVIKTHVLALISPNFAESVNLSLLTQQNFASYQQAKIATQIEIAILNHKVEMLDIPERCRGAFLHYYETSTNARSSNTLKRCPMLHITPL